MNCDVGASFFRPISVQFHSRKRSSLYEKLISKLGSDLESKRVRSIEGHFGFQVPYVNSILFEYGINYILCLYIYSVLIYCGHFWLCGNYYPVRPKRLSYLLDCFVPKWMIVWFIRPVRNLRLSQIITRQTSSSRSLSTPQLQGAFWSSCWFLF